MKETTKHYLPENLDCIPITIRDMIRNFNTASFSRAAFITPRDPAEITTFGEFSEQVSTLACAINTSGIAFGETIGILSENRTEWPLVYLAATSSGRVIAPFDIFFNRQELAHAIKESNCRILFTSGNCYRKTSEAAALSGKNIRIISFDAGPETESKTSDCCFTLHEFMQGNQSPLTDLPLLSPDTSAALIYSHNSLFAELSHNALLSNVQGFLTLSEHVFTRNDTILSALPLHHTFPSMFGFLIPLHTGSTTVFVPSVKPDDLFRTIKKTRPTVLVMVPLMLEILLHKLRETLLDMETTKTQRSYEGKDHRSFFREILSSHKGVEALETAKAELGFDRIRIIAAGGAKCPVPTLEILRDIGMPAFEGYGLTETAPLVATNTTLFNRTASVGKPLPGVDIRISDPDPAGNGEILVKGPNVMTGYYRMPEQTALMFDASGWFRTGDIGRFDQDGFLYITGRMKDVIINSGGKNIYPSGIETILCNSRFIDSAKLVPALIPGIGEYISCSIRPDIHALAELEAENNQRLTDQETETLIRNEAESLSAAIPAYKRPQAFEITYGPLPDPLSRSNPFMFDAPLNPEEPHSGPAEDTTTEIIDYAVDQIAGILGLEPADINPDQSLMELLDSIQLTELARRIETRTGIRLNPAVLFEHTTLSALSDYYRSLVSSDNTPESFSSESHADTRSSDTSGLIAVIGMHGRFPGSKDLREFWDHLDQGHSLISSPPEGRFSSSPGAGPEPLAGFIDDIDCFDPLFFSISPREAELMDPQQRLFLETVWHALEDAGIRPSSLSGTNTGIFAGVSTHDYSSLYDFNSPEADPFAATGLAHSILTNRISYLLNLHGPSEVIDTACSSALVAIHKAIQALNSGECDLAITGGVNALLSPGTFTTFMNAGMLSPDGSCKTFSSDADGYVRGEGAGVVILKPLESALRDSNRIDAVIRGSAIGHGGRAATMVAPNPRAQADIIARAWKQADVPPDTISYIEAHGTGTALGDPVEIQGLKYAFEELYQARCIADVSTAHCGLGSVKTNIGHLEAAAGIAGLIKVILSMKHETIPVSLNFTSLNPDIDLSGSQLHIAEKRRKWERLNDSAGNPVPRRAGVSSFGFGGVNAHVAVEEYIRHDAAVLTDSDSLYIVPMSARDSDSLKRLASSLQTVLESSGSKNTVSLDSIAFTLQSGRDAMKERLAFVAKTGTELTEQLKRFCDTGTVNPPDGFRGTVAGNQKPVAYSNTDSSETIAHLWVSGADVEWEHFWTHTPQPASLPGYPFHRHPFWIPETARQQSTSMTSGETARRLHPMIETNRSGVNGIRFTTRLTGEEFYLQDHRMLNRKYLPGVATLEMARAAGELAGISPVTGLKHIAWLRPVDVTRPVEIDIVLQQTGTDIHFEILMHDESGTPAKHSHGILITDDALEECDIEILDIEGIRDDCGQIMDAETCYSLFKSAGMSYGPSFRPIRSVNIGDQEALTLLELPEVCRDTFDSFTLHPTLIDGALQSVISLISGESNRPENPFFPFMLDEISLLKPLPETVYVHVTRKSKNTDDQTVQTFDIRILDRSGQVICSLSGFSCADGNRQQQATPEPAAIVRFTECWQETAHEPDGTGSPSTTLIMDTGEDVFNAFRNHCHCVLATPGETFRQTGDTCFEINPDSEEDYRKLIEQLKADDLFPDTLIHLWNAGDDFVKENHPCRNLYSLFFLCRSLISSQPETQVRVIVPFRGDMEQSPLNASVSGFLKTVAMESSKVTWKTIDLDTAPDQSHEILLSEASDPFIAEEVRYRDGIRRVRHFQEFIPEPDSSVALPPDGVYLITGGAGELGFLFARHLATQGSATFILTGRSKETDAVSDKIREIESLGSRAFYIRSDISDNQDVTELAHRIHDTWGNLSGIIHSAGLVRDSFLINKKAEDIDAVLAPKVNGTLFLDHAFRDDPLDFFVLFSSIAGIRGNIGQAEYAFANSFLDYYCDAREALRRAGKRSGKTVSVNWPLWENGGIRVDQQTELFFSALGIRPMQTETGLETFDLALSSPVTRLAVMEGDRNKIISMVSRKPPARKTPALLPGESGSLADTVRNDIRRLIAEIIKIEETYIDFDEEIRNYGFGSITFTEFSYRLNRKYNLSLIPTLFFEYTTIGAFVDYLCREYAHELREAYGRDHQDEPELVTAVPQTPRENPAGIRFMAPEDTAVAIIGMHGVLPGSDDLATFWKHLDAGDDLITETPVERWDWRDGLKGTARYGGFIPHADAFDADFFKISPVEAEWMDPQQRLFLEVCWKTIEDSGYPVSSLAGSRTGVFAASITADYPQLIGDNPLGMPAYLLTGTAKSMIANRVSYLLDLKGPSEPVDTACSSSLVAIHRGVEAILSGSCDMAIAGGVHLMFDPDLYQGYANAGILSKTGRCRPFSASGDGIVRSEGAGAVLLKPLKQAQADGDVIHGVIRGSAVNHGGRVNTLTTPNPIAQAELLSRAWKSSGISADTITYIEAHGTGTRLGDPIEINGIRKAFQNAGITEPIPATCGIGSVKSNIGHLEGAAGIAGVFKVLLAMKHKRIPATIHIDTLNPDIRTDKSPVYITETPVPWVTPTNGSGNPVPRRAGISSFGFGGSNAHILIEEAPETRVPVPVSRQMLFVLSARNRERLIEYTESILNHIREHEVDTRLVFTLQTGRDEMEERLAIVFDTHETLVQTLRNFLDGTQGGNLFTGHVGGGHRYHRTEAKCFTDVNGDLNRIAESWVRGGCIDWHSLYPEGTPGRMSLPTYPFARTRYWLPETVLKHSKHTTVSKPAGQSDPLAINTAEDVRQILRTIISDVMKLDAATLPDDFHTETYGIDSLAFMDILQEINSRMGLELDFYDIADVSSMNGLTESIAKLMGIASESLSDSDSALQSPLPDHAIRPVIEIPPVFPGSGDIGLSAVQAVTADGMSLEVVSAGSGPPLILLPPLDCNAGIWGHQLVSLSRFYTTVVFHYPGYGNSPFYPDSSSLSSIACMITDIIETLSIPQPYHLAGWSMGGFIAQLIAAGNSRDIRSLTLVNTAPAFREETSLSNINRLATLLREDFTSFPESLPERECLSIIKAITATEHLGIKKHYFSEILSFSAESEITRISSPTLIISGGKDRMIPAESADAFRTGIPHALTCDIDSAGHYIPLHHPEQFNTTLLDFLRETDVSGTPERQIPDYEIQAV